MAAKGRSCELRCHQRYLDHNGAERKLVSFEQCLAESVRKKSHPARFVQVYETAPSLKRGPVHPSLAQLLYWVPLDLRADRQGSVDRQVMFTSPKGGIKLLHTWNAQFSKPPRL
jgi:hypothetical protein